MKPNKVFLIILSVFITFGVLLGGIYFYISKVLTPDNIRDLLTQNLKETFPKAKIEVGEVDFKFGTSIDFIINKINVETSEPIASVSDTKLRIPVWSILKGGGVVEVEINSPQFYWSKLKKSESNWSQAMNSSPKKTSSSVPVVLPAFLATSRLNIKMKDSKIKYHLSENEKGTFLISKLLIKELGLENPAAFEVDTTIVMQQDTLGEISANMLVIGEADLHKFISQGKLSLVSVATISKIKSLKNGVFPLSEIRMDLKSDIYKTGNISGDAKMSFYDSTLSLKILRKEQEIKIENIKAILSVKDFLSFAPAITNKVNPGKSQLNIDGNIDLSNEQIKPQLQLTMTQGLSYSYLGQSFQPTFSGSLLDKNIDMKVDLPLYQGQSSTSVRLTLPKEFNFDNYIPDVVIDTNATGLVITKSDLEKINEASKLSDSPKDTVENKTNADNEVDKTINKNEQRLSILPLTWQLNVLESKFDEKDLSLKANTKISSKGVLTFISQLNIASGTLSTDIDFQAVDNSGKALLTFKKFPGSVVSPFVSQKMMSVNGEINGVVKTNFIKLNESYTYDSKYDLKVFNGKISKVDPSEWLASFIDAIKPFYPTINEVVKDIKIEPDFSVLELEGSATNEKLYFKDIFFKGIDNKFEISAKGTVFLNDSDESELLADYRDYKGNLSAFLLKEVGTEILPLKLVGLGTNIKPDISYTSKKLSSILLKKKGTNKVKDIAKKFLKDGDKKKLDKLLKGILK